MSNDENRLINLKKKLTFIVIVILMVLMMPVIVTVIVTLKIYKCANPQDIKITTYDKTLITEGSSIYHN